jgi:hypothetical protein
MQVLKEKGGETPKKEVISEVAYRLTFDDWEKGNYFQSFLLTITAPRPSSKSDVVSGTNTAIKT